MSVTPSSIKMLDLYLGKRCKVVYRDGGANSRAKAFYGVLKAFDDQFQTWEGGNEPKPRQNYTVTFNHEDISRIVLEVGEQSA
jgi:hypothetical protein